MAEPAEKLPRARDARRAPRGRVLLAGKLIHGGGAFTHNCVVRNLSFTGARLKIDSGTALPKEFYLIDLRAGLAYDCKLVWRNGSEIGVQFISTVTLDPLEDPKFGFLRRIYVEARPR